MLPRTIFAIGLLYTTGKTEPTESTREGSIRLGTTPGSQHIRVGSDDTLILPKPVQSPEETLSHYLQDIGAIPLLTADEEIQLAQLIERGREAQRKLEQRLSAEEHSIAIQESQQGEEARHKLIESNLRLVVSVARRYNRDRDLPLEDRISEGNIGLMRAVEKYDYRLGYRFSTYATWWIRQAVTRALDNQAHTVRLPVHVSEMVRQISRESYQLSQQLGRRPTSEELAQSTGISTEQINEVLHVSQRPTSLDMPCGSEGETTLGEFVEDETTEQPAEHALREVMITHLQEAIRGLKPQYQRVLSLRYGLDGGTPRRLQEIGDEIGLTRERVRQIEQAAFKQLRQQEETQHLREFLS